MISFLGQPFFGESRIITVPWLKSFDEGDISWLTYVHRKWGTVKCPEAFRRTRGVCYVRDAVGTIRHRVLRQRAVFEDWCMRAIARRASDACQNVQRKINQLSCHGSLMRV